MMALACLGIFLGGAGLIALAMFFASSRADRLTEKLLCDDAYGDRPRIPDDLKFHAARNSRGTQHGRS